ncbi:hypothetical protein NIIDMKKI_28990 [Mycobacterium kansasii]|uniref:Uncharacterized protein n=1 Tax=Mycobacterium kansasii TaxID=1768 RepID=A0A7G1IBK1_MYCKA|nr:hypothetical protein NIIDMKKI_28990 [Mycobacterium kansasii]
MTLSRLAFASDPKAKTPPMPRAPTPMAIRAVDAASPRRRPLPIRNAKFFVKAVHVRLDRAARQVKSRRDLRNREPVGHHRDHLGLTLGQQGRRSPAPPCHLTSQPAGYPGRQVRGSFGASDHGVHDLVAVGFLGQESRGALGQSLVYDGTVIKRAQQHHAGGQSVAGYRVGDLETIQLGHLVVEKCDRRPQLPDGIQRRAAVGHLGDDFHPPAGLEGAHDPWRITG